MSKVTINLTCDTCNKVHVVDRSSEIPGWVIALACNWCPCCEDQADGYWEERYLPENEGDDPPNIPTPVPDNQLTMPFIFDEIGVPKSEEIKSEVA